MDHELLERIERRLHDLELLERIIMSALENLAVATTNLNTAVSAAVAAFQRGAASDAAIQAAAESVNAAAQSPGLRNAAPAQPGPVIAMPQNHPKRPPVQLAWHNSRPRKWWTIARIRWDNDGNRERREATVMRRRAMCRVVEGSQ